MRAITEQQKQEAIAAFAYEGTLIADTVYGSGHINDTFRLTFAVGNMGDLDVILHWNRTVPGMWQSLRRTIPISCRTTNRSGLR